MEVVNPNVSYTVHIPQSKTIRVKGLAISLKEFIGKLDVHGIQHDGEKIIRQKLRGHPRCQTRKKQFFNVVECGKKEIIRAEVNSVRCLTCVCVPFDEFPVEAVDKLQQNGKIG